MISDKAEVDAHEPGVFYEGAEVVMFCFGDFGQEVGCVVDDYEVRIDF